MYDIAISLYLVGVAVASLFNEKVRKMWRGERHAISDIRRRLDPSASYIWVHAASLGEFEQGRPIMERIRREHPEYKILLTFFSPSGYEVRKDWEGADIVTYLPLDTPRNARRFLRTISPVCALFIKYEFWYNYLHILRHRGVPTYSVSSIFRPGQVFFRWYAKGYAGVLRCFTHFFVQNDLSRELLHRHLGIDNVTITGDTRFDRVIDIAREAKSLPAVESFCGTDRVFIAGSSWQPDEEIFIPFFASKAGWRLIIAPHVIAEEHLRQIERLCEAHSRRAVRYSRAKDGVPAEATVLIIDCFGLLSSVYRYADITYVGGGFGVGIHNVLEAAVWRKPVVFGPNNARFQEAQDLKVCGGGHEITCGDDFRRVMDGLISDASRLTASGAAAGEYVSGHSGATATVTAALNL